MTGSTNLIAVTDAQTFVLSNGSISYVFCVTPEGVLEHLYFGRAVSDPLAIKSRAVRAPRGCTVDFEGIPNLNLNAVAQEYPTLGTSDYRYPAFSGKTASGDRIFSPRFNRYEITNEKPGLDGLPSARGGSTQTSHENHNNHENQNSHHSQTLIVTLSDPVQSLEIDLLYTIYCEHDVIARSVRVRNVGSSTLSLSHIASLSLDIGPGHYEVLHCFGTWAREFQQERIPIPTGRFTIDSIRGTSSAAHQPFMAVMSRDATETHGDVFATTLIYSGNHAISTEVGEFGDVRLVAGINPTGFEWTLDADETFFSPEALLVYSPEGLGGMSRIWHNFIRDKISPERFRFVPRPTYLNTWEAAYFNVNEDRVLALADIARDVGVEMLVLDDGWFKGRVDDRRALGDWTPDPDRFPSGISALGAAVRAKGLKFGLWLEPEMVSPNSDLYTAHPDWALQTPANISGRNPSLGRQQLTLDLSRQDVVDHVFGMIDTLLVDGQVDYIKWDMNRHMSNVGSSGWPPDRQGEIAHRYILGLYALLRRVSQKYPDIFIEGCASGGNRFDLGMLSYVPQMWTSDMCDPVGRLDILHGCSYLYPMDVTAAYIGPSPNHQNGRVSSLEARYHAGVFCAAQGLSLNRDDILADLPHLKDLMQTAKGTSQMQLGADFHRLDRSENHVVWQQTSRDGTVVRILYFTILSSPNAAFSRAYPTGLVPDALYQSEHIDGLIRGDVLMYAGLPLPYMSMDQTGENVAYMPKGDFASVLITLTRTN